ncbi:chemotaxis protein CheC [Anaerobacillus sp. HL2]|nr:chemotaxis protein CheC [Anaerobacillus sp. HL2]
MTLTMVKTMCGMEVTEVDMFVSSALGEVVNIISGNALTKLTEKGMVCDILPPKIIVKTIMILY